MSFERGNFLLLRPVLLKNAYFNSANRELSIDIRHVELRQRKIVDPSRGAPYAQSSEIFVFRQKIERAVIFLSFGQSC